MWPSPSSPRHTLDKFMRPCNPIATLFQPQLSAERSGSGDAPLLGGLFADVGRFTNLSVWVVQGIESLKGLRLREKREHEKNFGGCLLLV